MLTFLQYSSFQITTNLEPLSWTLTQQFFQVLISLRASLSFFMMLWNTLVLTVFGWKMLCSIFTINASKQWELVALTRKLAVLTTFLMVDLLTVFIIVNWRSVEDWVEFWNKKRSLLTKLSTFCFKLCHILFKAVRWFSKVVKNTLFVVQIFRSHFSSFFCVSNFIILFLNMLQRTP